MNEKSSQRFLKTKIKTLHAKSHIKSFGKDSKNFENILIRESQQVEITSKIGRGGKNQQIDTKTKLKYTCEN